ncbi:lipocalin-like domain-containing protein [Aggregatilinea lenta]|uniref:lipocalin-like domain-containing protein n=1 Tax=Aggregatilinea lenta TaxID=913108 RepID=UPI000E5B0E77|nr:lipocalin-like domain-containing protein [Aggregatilinea lenta]
MRRLIPIGVLLLTVALLVWGLLSHHRGDSVDAGAVYYPVLDTGIDGFERAITPYDWSFPADYGPHFGFQTEWWYYTGNLATDEGRRFGFQFTIFRRAITPNAPASSSEWRSNQVYMAHLTVTDVETGQFVQSQRLSRAGDALAGATTDPVFRVWLEDWQIAALDQEAQHTQITAATTDAALDLTLEQVKPPALQGDEGLSPKGGEPGNASYYYSLSRLITRGEITVDGTPYAVSGTTWMDHEFSTSALASNAVGWDWFGLQIDDNRELMLGQIRLQDGGTDPAFSGMLILPDGSTRKLDAADFTITPVSTWTSPHTGATYPAAWDISVDTGEAQPLRLSVTPLVDDQELIEGISYWEGAVRIEGDATGYGYAELTGYTGPMQGRF